MFFRRTSQTQMSCSSSARQAPPASHRARVADRHIYLAPRPRVPRAPFGPPTRVCLQVRQDAQPATSRIDKCAASGDPIVRRCGVHRGIASPCNTLHDGYGTSPDFQPTHIERHRQQRITQCIHQMTRRHVASVTPGRQQHLPLASGERLHDNLGQVPPANTSVRQVTLKRTESQSGSNCGPSTCSPALAAITSFGVPPLAGTRMMPVVCQRKSCCPAPNSRQTEEPPRRWESPPHRRY